MLMGVTEEGILRWLFNRQRFGVHPGLTRMNALLERLGHPERHFQSVLIGGTNGKGSTATTLASILQAGGQRVGLFTSPHLMRFTERFLVNGQERPEREVLLALERLQPLAEEVGATFFEIVTALGCVLFAQAGVQIAVMEVGLGGRLDSTNALDPVLSVVTNVALDHTAILGETPAAIAAEKAGILRPGRPAVTGVEVELRPIFQAVGADLWVSGEQFRTDIHSLGWSGSEVQVKLPETSFTFRTPLLGAHGARNAALAGVAAYRLGSNPESIMEGTATTFWPGRLEVLPLSEGKIVLDGAHNPAGAQALARTLQELAVPPVPVIFGATADKEIAEVAQALAPIASRVILTRALLSPRAAQPPDLAAHFHGLPTTITQTPQEALQSVVREPLSVACGSLYLIGELRSLILGETGETWERWQ